MLIHTQNVLPEIAVNLVDLGALAWLLKHWFMLVSSKHIKLVNCILWLFFDIISLLGTQIKLRGFLDATEGRSGCNFVALVIVLVNKAISLNPVILEAHVVSKVFAIFLSLVVMALRMGVEIQIPYLVYVLFFVWWLKIERSWNTFISNTIIHLTIIVSPFLFTCLKRRYKAHFFKVVSLVSWVFLWHILHIRPKEIGKLRHWHRSMLKWAATILPTISTWLMRAATLRAWPHSRAFGCSRQVIMTIEWEIFTLDWVVSHHFHMIPFH